MRDPDGTVFCDGCGHPVGYHTGPGAVQPDCDCCSWRQNEPQGRWVAGPLGLPVVEMNEGNRRAR